MAKISENKSELVDEIMGFFNATYKKDSGVYKVVEKGLMKLAVYELTSVLLMLKTSN